jgi:hypothetical protein
MYERTYHKTVLHTDTEPVKKTGQVNWKLLLKIFIAAVVLAGIVIAIRVPKFQVKHVVVVGANVVDPGDVTEFVTQQLQGHKFFILPRTSIFIIPESALEKNLKEKFPRLQTVSISRTNFSTLTITVTEYQGIYLWCSDETTCDFMDQNGVAFSAAPYFSGNAYPKIFIGTAQSLPFQAISPEQVTRIGLLMERLPVIGIVPAEFHFVSPHELDVDFNHDGHQAQLLFDPTADTRVALVSLYTGLRTNPLASQYQDATQVLHYIDLRFANRVVYKFQ